MILLNNGKLFENVQFVILFNFEMILIHVISNYSTEHEIIIYKHHECYVDDYENLFRLLTYTFTHSC